MPPKVEADESDGVADASAASRGALELDLDMLGISDDFGLGGPKHKKSKKVASDGNQEMRAKEGEARAIGQGVKPGKPSLQQKRKARVTGKLCTACGCRDTSKCPLDPNEKSLWGYYRWFELILDDGEEKLSWEQVVAKRQHTVVIWKPKGSSIRLVYELVTEGNTCFCDVKLWKGVYESEMTLSVWKTQATFPAYCVIISFQFFRSICVFIQVFFCRVMLSVV